MSSPGRVSSGVSLAASADSGTLRSVSTTFAGSRAPCLAIAQPAYVFRLLRSPCSRHLDRRSRCRRLRCPSPSGGGALAFEANGFAFVVTRKRCELLHHAEWDGPVGETAANLC